MKTFIWVFVLLLCHHAYCGGPGQGSAWSKPLNLENLKKETPTITKPEPKKPAPAPAQPIDQDRAEKVRLALAIGVQNYKDLESRGIDPSHVSVVRNKGEYLYFM